VPIKPRSSPVARKEEHQRPRRLARRQGLGQLEHRRTARGVVVGAVEDRVLALALGRAHDADVVVVRAEDDRLLRELGLGRGAGAGQHADDVRGGRRLDLELALEAQRLERAGAQRLEQLAARRDRRRGQRGRIAAVQAARRRLGLGLRARSFRTRRDQQAEARAALLAQPLAPLGARSVEEQRDFVVGEARHVLGLADRAHAQAPGARDAAAPVEVDAAHQLGGRLGSFPGGQLRHRIEARPRQRDALQEGAVVAGGLQAGALERLGEELGGAHRLR
jgi:hypothetical protein